MSENNLKMSSSPHIRSKATTSNIYDAGGHRTFAGICIWCMELWTAGIRNAGYNNGCSSIDGIHIRKINAQEDYDQ